MEKHKLLFIGLILAGVVMLGTGIYLSVKPEQNTAPQIFQTVVSTPVTTQTVTSNKVSKSTDVPMDTPWTSTGINVESGQTINITASGKGVWKNISKSNPNAVPNAYEECSPDGTLPNSGDYWSNISQYQTREANKGALIGRIGTNGKPFKVGSQFSQRINENGTLYLGINDMRKEVDSSSYNDNSGSFQAKIEIK